MERRLVAARHAARTGGRAIQAAVRNGPLHRRADEHRGGLNPLAARAASARSAAAAVDLVAVVLVVGDPVEVVEGAVVALHGVIIIVPEVLQPLFFAGHAFRTISENVPPRLPTAVAQPFGSHRPAA